MSFTGHVTDLKDQVVSQVSLGKAHAVALTSKGRIYTFGINNKGQCGRDFNPGAAKDGKNKNFLLYHLSLPFNIAHHFCNIVFY